MNSYDGNTSASPSKIVLQFVTDRATIPASLLTSNVQQNKISTKMLTVDINNLNIKADVCHKPLEMSTSVPLSQPLWTSDILPRTHKNTQNGICNHGYQSDSIKERMI